MRDQTIINLIENSRKDLVARIEMSEKFVGDTAFQVIGLIMLIRSIPVIGRILTKLIERNIKQYQRIVQRQAVKQYKERKNGKLDSNEGKDKSKP